MNMTLTNLVYNKLKKQHNLEFNRPCITVKYSDGYHVDLAIYSDNNNDLHIAWGKQYSTTNRCWYKSEPKKLTQWVSDVSTETKESEQFRQCVRYLKKWKERKFSCDGNSAPPSIGLTIQARNAFYNMLAYKKNTIFVSSNISNHRNLIKNQDNLQRISEKIQMIIDELSNKDNCKKIHLFLSVQSTLALDIGRKYQEGIHKNWIIHNFNASREKYSWAIELSKGGLSRLY